MSKEQINELADKIIADYKEQYDFSTGAESHMHDCITSDLEEFAQLEKAPEPVAWVRRHPDGSVTNEYLSAQAIDAPRKRSAVWVPLYTSPPEVAELQKQVQDLISQNTDYLERLLNVRGSYEATNKTTEQAHVDLAESQHKVTDLEKQVQALQAEVDRFRNPPSVATVAIELEIDNQLTASAMDPNNMFRQDGDAVHAAFIEALDKEKLC